MNSAPQKLVIPNKLLTSDVFLGSGSPRIAFILRLLGLMSSLLKVCLRNSSDLMLYLHLLLFRVSPFSQSRLNITWRFWLWSCWSDLKQRMLSLMLMAPLIPARTWLISSWNISMAELTPKKVFYICTGPGVLQRWLYIGILQLVPIGYSLGWDPICRKH